ncbi:hypothetical protein [Nocardia barduliensis]|uniref:hypothetical protein n=1 Tax=Nocardia barduliensis TaxID=2736643 RepID=UPI001573CE91|nr:hypothetical protein [Nocardia barduliensis]
MVQPTPWQGNTPRNGRDPTKKASAAAAQGQRGYQVALRGYWGYAWAAASSVVTLVLLFQPWITASGADGSVRANAFGRMQITTVFLNVWSQSKPRTAHITGFWALLASAAIVVTVLAVVINLRFRIEALTRLATLSTLATMLLVLITAVYVNSKGGQMKAMVSRTTDLGGHVGSLLNWAFNNGRLAMPGSGQYAYASASLTQWAFLAIALSIGSAVAAVTQWMRNGSTNLFRLPVAIKFAKSQSASPEAGDADQP